ncbi:MAG TPA: inositol monophosphatase family protein, partial [Pyrinomonadaceae bacterium]|nr:inositol monophosphatase family protein [Pyrinomonadaceae bacterium]
ARGAGSWVTRPDLEAERLRVADKTRTDEMRLAASRSHRSPRTDAVIRALGISEEVKRHSVGIKVGLIVERQADIYVHLSQGTKQWDTCAPEAVLAEAGGVMTDLWGEPLRYNVPDVRNRNGLVATSAAAHALVVRTITPLLAEFGRERIADD